MTERCLLTLSLIVGVALGFGSCAVESDDAIKYVQYVGQTMGTTYSVKHESNNGEDLQPLIDYALAEVNMALSTYIPESLISQFNQNGMIKVAIDRRSEHFRKNLDASSDIHRRSQKAFDPTVGPLINAWGFGWEGRKPEAPNQEMIDSLLSLVGFARLTYSISGDSLYVSTSVENMVLDMSAIAKGYGVDVVAELMEAKGIDKTHNNVWFGQLYGMSDHITYNLAKEGYNVAKYIPFGPVKDVMPYLIRRAEENTSVAGQTSRELSLLKKEKLRRKL